MIIRIKDDGFWLKEGFGIRLLNNTLVSAHCRANITYTLMENDIFIESITIKRFYVTPHKSDLKKVGGGLYDSAILKFLKRILK